MLTVSRITFACIAAATLALGAVTPAMAQSSGHGRSNDRDRYSDNMGSGRDFAVEQCTRAATDSARGGNARVVRMGRVASYAGGYQVNGTVAHYERGRQDARYERMIFTCRVEQGRVADLQFRPEAGYRRR